MMLSSGLQNQTQLFLQISPVWAVEVCRNCPYRYLSDLFSHRCPRNLYIMERIHRHLLFHPIDNYRPGS